MNVNEIGKAGVLGGVLVLVVDFIIGLIYQSAVFAFSFMALLFGCALAGWMVKKRWDAVVAGVTAGLIYAVFGFIVIFPWIFKSIHVNMASAILIGVVMGAVGGLAGQYLVSYHKSSKKAPKAKKR